MAAHQAPPSLGFSRQEYWSGLPFPSPMHENEKGKWKVKVKLLCCAQLLATPWTAAYQAPPSMGFSRQEYWSGVPLPSPNGFIFNTKYMIYVTMAPKEAGMLNKLSWSNITWKLDADCTKNLLSFIFCMNPLWLSLTSAIVLIKKHILIISMFTWH